MRRRDFLENVTIAASAAVALTSVASLARASQAAAAPQDIQRGDMRYRRLGRTGVEVSLIGLGGYHLGIATESETIKIIRSAIDGGINFLDNCWSYHKGDSEVRMGKALRDGYREKAFLMSKFDGRTKKAAAEQIDESLKRLQTDHLDLMQFHENIRLEDPDRFFGPDGAAEALQAAQKAGKLRFMGFTGHKDPSVHLRMLELADQRQFRFEACQLPLNLLDAHFRSFEKQVVPKLVERQIGVLGMKPLASGAILKAKLATAIECLHYAMNLPTSVVITGIESMEQLGQAFEAVKTFKPMAKDEVQALLKKTAQEAATGKHERFKTDIVFDSTSREPQLMGEFPSM